MANFNGPTYDEMMPDLFQAMKDLGGSATIHEINERTMDRLGLSERVRAYPHLNTGRSEVEYRLAWTRTYLKKDGILENSARGVWSLTAKGSEMNSVDPAAIVHRVRLMQALSAAPNAEIEGTDDHLTTDNSEMPEEAQSWREKARNVLLNMTPAAFERLAQRLLRESGFTQVVVTGRTGDGGIDGTGIIRLNGMISFHMLFQCKRYRDSVGAGEMRDFRGAMQGRADKGLFITTGKFTDAALKEANRVGTTPIDTMDGDELIEKLRELRLGITPVMDYEIDEAWFAAI